MRRDVKIGLFVGVVISVAVAGTLLTRPDPAMRNVDPILTHDSVEKASGRSGENTGPAVSSAPQSTAPAAPAAPPTEATTVPSSAKDEKASSAPMKATRFHIVQQEDTLSSISKKYYGTSAGWKKIYEANKAVVPNPNSLKIGTKLTIPD